MLSKIIEYSVNNRYIILLFTTLLLLFGIFSLTQIHIGAVPDITNNQVQVITTSQNLSTQDIEQFITYPVELEMANLPGVKEIRSISKFGLSVVTVVFEDNLGTYLPRQLIAEKIKMASEKIPEGYGTPEMGPISTGLGEIYQYILDTKPGYEHRYDATDLRTIQDWIVKRQLSGIPGVVEVNSWGGYLKQYEVAIDPNKLQATNITVSEIFEALEQNNDNAGGSYIEKNNITYFIRAEGLFKSIEDIENIVVKSVNGFPIQIKDFAQVKMGSAPRYGAITGNGQGEKVLGQVLMIKDGNSKKVIDAVKDRVLEISESLPEGVYINAFLERSELIAKTTFTITENLILGCLIVIFIVVLFLGNWRSGLIVASIIPLSLFFAISLMNLLHVDANLMSLGAIDFGIIIDGAVIIVEYIAYKTNAKAKEILNLPKAERQEKMDQITIASSTKMMDSAVFGQLIILIVFIPILSLSGVEGKLFKPMALTFSFAIIGALILCLTYVPAISSILLKPEFSEKKSITDRIFEKINQWYQPSLAYGLENKKMVFGSAIGLLFISVIIFLRLGGEFVPTLDEGDFVIQPVLKTGTSLSKTVETTTKIETILLENYPEISQIVSRIGAAEIPTDPMSMEEVDVIIKLKPKGEWVSAKSKDELANLFKESLKVLPGVDIEFTQPIEMRFNELITGVRADIAVKVFGEDLNLLSDIANEIKKNIENVEGASDIVVEKVVGLPQLNISYNREKIGRYGLSIEDVNRIIVMGFSGEKAGEVYEGEKKFDLVMRFTEEVKSNIDAIKNIQIDGVNGQKIPLNDLANITYAQGPAKISRDETKRRIVVGINVRNRDLQSVVREIQSIVDQNITLPPGYLVTYGGQFENLENAKSRLMVALPVALLLIFIMLYFAFRSFKDAMIIYSAIPLAAVGGFLFLWIRDLPFSISAGIGFIALFGIAVLNGIVLIKHFKEMNIKPDSNIHKMIQKGTQERLRPVLLTASAAALGFLPMAISTNVGAEVQRPLATVVIGGLITSTFLTLIVLPVLYAYFINPKRQLEMKTSFIILAIGIFSSTGMFAQDQSNGYLEFLQKEAQTNNAALKSASFAVDQSKAEINAAFTFDKTEVYYHYDENNIAPNNIPLKVLGVQQNFLFPTLYFNSKKINERKYEMMSTQYDIEKRDLNRKVAQAYYETLYFLNVHKAYQKLDSLYTQFSKNSRRRFELGETNYLESINAQAQHRKIQVELKQAEQNVGAAQIKLNRIVQSEEPIEIQIQNIEPVVLNSFDIENHEGFKYLALKTDLLSLEENHQKQRYLPDLSLQYFIGSNNSLSDNMYGYQLGLKFPLLFSCNMAQVKSSRIAKDRLEQEKIQFEQELLSKQEIFQQELLKHREYLDYYESEGKVLADELIRTADRSFKRGEIDFFDYIRTLENATRIHLDYLHNLNNYNQIALSIKYLNL